MFFNWDFRGLGSYWNKFGSFYSCIDIVCGVEGGDDML